VRLGLVDLLPRTEEPQGVRPGGKDDLLRGVGAEGPDDLPAVSRLELLDIASGVLQDLAHFVDWLHRFLPLKNEDRAHFSDLSINPCRCR
jgi:hypothetical protein